MWLSCSRSLRPAVEHRPGKHKRGVEGQGRPLTLTWKEGYVLGEHGERVQILVLVVVGWLVLL